MDFIDVSKKVKEFQKGSIHKITYTKECKVPKGSSYTVTKTSIAPAAFGVNYDRLKAVSTARNKGQLPEVNDGLPAGTEWYEFPYFIKSIKSGKIQLRVTKRGIPESKYYKDGQEITKEEAKKLCLKSEFPDYKENKVAPPIFNVGIEKIDKLE